MSKVKIVQIVKMEDGVAPYFIDSEGRVWYDAGRVQKRTEDGKTISTWVPSWQQVELPDVPTK